ncbi:FG-GAP-like repeat-containing protein, partial [Bacteroidota bacterium]
GQTTFTPHTVDDNFNSPAGIYSADIDMDGDNDIVAGSGAQGVVWWRNDGGNPIVWTRLLVDANITGCLSVFVADIFRDGRPDIVATSYAGHKMIYYKNEGGDPISWSKNTIAINFRQAHEVFVYDFDGDGNMDVFGAAAESNEISWWHNEGGDPITWTKQVVDNNYLGARSVYAEDIDGDGDTDIAGAALVSNELTWWRNDGGSPVNWTKVNLSDTFNGSHRVQIVDMDNDGDNDILGTAFGVTEIAWWRNEGGTPVVWTKHIVDSNLPSAVIGYAIDIDLDGLKDVLGTGQGSNNVVWYRNKGGQNYTWEKNVLDDSFGGAWPAFAIDLDGDLDIDLMAGGNSANEIRIWENRRTGRFQTSINFNDEPTNIAYYVPSDYDPGQAYKLVVGLHYCEDENTYLRYRDLLMNISDSLNAIIMCMDCHNTLEELDIPDPSIIPFTIDYTKMRYNIDEDYIYLTGGSCNGHSTLQYGLNYIYDFRGIIPFNAYIPDVSSLYYDFASDMPTCICSGTLDPNYSNNVEIYNNMLANSGKVYLNSMPDIGHEFFFPTFDEEMMECFSFIDSIAEVNTSVSDLFQTGKSQITIYPNPVSSILNVKLQAEKPQEIVLDLFDINGKMIKKIYKGKLNQGENIIQINAENEFFNSGVYMLRSIIEGKTGFSKIIISG